MFLSKRMLNCPTKYESHHLDRHLFKRLTCLIATCFILFACPADAQRSLSHWRRDLDHQLGLYSGQLGQIQGILNSAINVQRRVPSANNVRFSDLIIPTGALILDSQVARSTVRIMINKTQTYVASKMNELYQIQSQLAVIKRQVRNASRTFVYKGTFNDSLPQNQPYIIPNRMGGTRIFKQFMYGRYVESKETQLREINYTNVDHVINETYLENQQIGAFDSKQRIFYEGRKTFWKSIFTNKLQSGCCDRLKPIHTNQMMTRSSTQHILAPVLFHTNARQQPVVINILVTDQGPLHNRFLAHSTIRRGPNLPDIHELMPSPKENFIFSDNLIGIRQPEQSSILKTLIFKDLVMIDNAYVKQSAVGDKIIIGFVSDPGLLFNLSHENYLLKYLTSKNSTDVQSVSGPVVINGDIDIVSGVNATDVNQIPFFRRYAREQIVRIDKPTTIRSSVQFNALPLIFTPSGPSRAPQSVPILHLARGLYVGLLNGMRIPLDILPISHVSSNATIRIRGPRRFLNQVDILAPVKVRGPINGLQLPHEIIPLHIPDIINQFSMSNLWFTNGIIANHINIRENQFDDIPLQEVYGDAQNLIMRSMFTLQPDGNYLIRSPLRVNHLNLIDSTPERGLLNGFRPQNLIELTSQPRDTILGKKTFLATVYADECLFNEINRLPNWSSHLIRIDRPDTVQTVYTKLAFEQPLSREPNFMNQDAFGSISSIGIRNFRIDFHPNKNQFNYMSNLDFSPEFYNIYQALERSSAGSIEGRYRVLGLVQLFDASGGAGRVNGIDLNDIVTLDSPFRFADRFVMVGKVEVIGTLSASRITSNYPLDVMDLVQFEKYRIPISGSLAPIRLSNLALAATNRASYIQSYLLNGTPLNAFVESIMSLTRPQVIDNNLLFTGPVNLDGIVKTESSLNGIREFRKFANSLKSVRYSFEDGLLCNSVMLKL